MSLDSKSAADLIVATYAKTVPSPAGAKALPQDFCKLWPTAKPILTAVSGIVLLFPGLGQTAAGILAGLIAVGDKIAKDTCK
jgi:hypothetical protein